MSFARGQVTAGNRRAAAAALRHFSNAVGSQSDIGGQ
jgi:hypothetical protein